MASIHKKAKFLISNVVYLNLVMIGEKSNFVKGKSEGISFTKKNINMKISNKYYITKTF